LAIGARRSHIRTQFLVEALVICLLGGVIGLIVGMVGAALIAALAGWPVFLSPAAMVMAMLFAGMTGVFFGYYPARIAARSNPIDCLSATKAL